MSVTLLLLAGLALADDDVDPRISADEDPPEDGGDITILGEGAGERPEKVVLDDGDNEDTPERVVLVPAGEEDEADEEDDGARAYLAPAAEPTAPVRAETDQLTLETLSKDPVVRAYEVARAAYEREDWAGALDRARKVLVLDEDHVGARIIEAGSLHRLRQWEDAMAGFHALADDPGAGEDARRMIGLYDNRWRRDQPSLSLGATLRDDHAVEDKQWGAGFVAELEAPLAGPVNLRIDVASGWQTRGQLGVKGPQLAAMVTAHQPIGIWSLDAGVGPGLWLGRSLYWNSTYTGPFPMYRAAAGASVRPLRNLGLRAELGHAGGWGTKTLLGGFSAGLDARLMVTGYIR